MPLYLLRPAWGLAIARAATPEQARSLTLAEMSWLDEDDIDLLEDIEVLTESGEFELLDYHYG